MYLPVILGVISLSMKIIVSLKDTRGRLSENLTLRRGSSYDMLHAEHSTVISS